MQHFYNCVYGTLTSIAGIISVQSYSGLISTELFSKISTLHYRIGKCIKSMKTQSHSHIMNHSIESNYTDCYNIETILKYFFFVYELAIAYYK